MARDSRARGDADDRSDVDLLVIKAHVADRYEELVALDRALAGILMPVDILLVSEAEFEERAEQPGTVERATRKEGRVLYAACRVLAGVTECELLFGFKLCFRQARLPDDGSQGASFDFVVIRHRHGGGALVSNLLHDDVAASPAHFREPVRLKNPADIGAGKDTQPTLRRPPTGSRRPRWKGGD